MELFILLWLTKMFSLGISLVVYESRNNATDGSILISSSCGFLINSNQNHMWISVKMDIPVFIERLAFGASDIIRV